MEWHGIYLANIGCLLYEKMSRTYGLFGAADSGRRAHLRRLYLGHPRLWLEAILSGPPAGWLQPQIPSPPTGSRKPASGGGGRRGRGPAAIRTPHPPPPTPVRYESPPDRLLATGPVRSIAPRPMARRVTGGRPERAAAIGYTRASFMEAWEGGRPRPYKWDPPRSSSLFCKPSPSSRNRSPAPVGRKCHWSNNTERKHTYIYSRWDQTDITSNCFFF